MRKLAFFLFVVFLLLKLPGEVLHAYEHHAHQHEHTSDLSFDSGDCGQCSFAFLDATSPILPFVYDSNNYAEIPDNCSSNSLLSRECHFKPTRGSPRVKVK